MMGAAAVDVVAQWCSCTGYICTQYGFVVDL